MNFTKREQALERGEAGRLALPPYQALILSDGDRV
jgi:hypothetical protein